MAAKTVYDFFEYIYSTSNRLPTIEEIWEAATEAAEEKFKAPNNRSDEIAFAQSVNDLCYRDMELSQIVGEVMKLSNARIAQLRAVR